MRKTRAAQKRIRIKPHVFQLADEHLEAGVGASEALEHDTTPSKYSASFGHLLSGEEIKGCFTQQSQSPNGKRKGSRASATTILKTWLAAGATTYNSEAMDDCTMKNETL